MHLLNRIPRWLNARRQPLVAGLVVLSVFVASLGIPLALEPQRDTSRPYPCMQHRCGCGSAEACWQGCCCMTLAQKLVWAKEHGVTPPDYALALAEQEVQKESETSAACGSCAHHHDCATEQEPIAPTTVDETKGIPALGLVLTEDFRRCHGLGSVWLTMGQALPPQVNSSIPRYQPVPVAWLTVTSHSAESPPLALDTPPPRHS